MLRACVWLGFVATIGLVGNASALYGYVDVEERSPAADHFVCYEQAGTGGAKVDCSVGAAGKGYKVDAFAGSSESKPPVMRCGQVRGGAVIGGVFCAPPRV
ncbi:MAG TPA: hypothetical protein VM681_10910 [Candidatus Thermoplasmatota archaeon]|nr:hypothetical protein [Candidatus Thermoplasmatota archaeon]